MGSDMQKSLALIECPVWRRNNKHIDFGLAEGYDDTATAVKAKKRSGILLPGGGGIVYRTKSC